MKVHIPEISWHNRDPVLSVDFQPIVEGSDKFLRLASGGSDSHVLIWYVSHDETGVTRLELAADLTRHQRAVNCVRWSPSGEYLASCDDESVIFIWRLKPESETANLFDDASEGDKETWLTYKILRGHMEDVYDLSWSQDSQFLISGSVDNTAMIWDVKNGKSTAIIKEHKGFVQGVAWDPLNKYLATLSTDRYFRVFDVQTKKNVLRANKSCLPVPKESPLFEKSVRLFHDDTLQTFFRRLSFSPDGTLIVVPSGIAEVEGSSAKPFNTTYIYTRYSLKEPAVVLPSPDQFTVAVRFCPLLFELRKSKSEPVISLPYRMIFAIATKCSVYLYDTQQKLPFGLISNIHYTRLTDLAWSNDGNTLLVSSTDGYCSIVQFAAEELGKVYKEQSLQEILSSKMMKDEPKKKKKSKKPNSAKKEDDKEKSSPTTVDEKENPVKMEVDPPNETEVRAPKTENLLASLSDSIKETIPADNIIKSNDIFSPEKQIGSPATPIQVRKFPRNLDNVDDSPHKSESGKGSAPNTPKAAGAFSSVTPSRIEIRRQPRVLQTQPSRENVNETSEISQKLTPEPKSKKKIL